MSRVFITGGAGFIGARLSEMLAERGAEITVFDNLSPQIHGTDGASPTRARAEAVATLIQGDVRDADALAAALLGHDAVVHLAAETGTGQSMYAQQHYVDVNVTGTVNLLRAVTDAGGVKRVTVAATRAVYGEGQYIDGDRIIAADPRDPARLERGDFKVYSPVTGQEILPKATDETCLLKPSSIYAITKLAQEQMILNYSQTSAVETAALRLQNVYGPGQSLKNPYTGLLSVFSTRILNGKPLNIFEDGLCTRDFVFIDDVARALMLATLSEVQGLGIVNIGSGEATTILRAAELLSQELGPDTAREVTGAYRAGDIRSNFADIRRAEALLGFTPGPTVEEGIRAFAAWVRTQPVAEDLFDKSMAELRDHKLLGQAKPA